MSELSGGRVLIDSASAANLATVLTGGDTTGGLPINISTGDNLQFSGDTFIYRSAAGIIVLGTANNNALASLYCSIKPTTKTTATYSISAAESNTKFNNNGALAQVAFTAPAAVPGLTFSFYVATAQNIRVIGNGTDTIRIGTSVSTATTGHVDNATIGSYLTLECHVAGKWISASSEGTAWTVT